MKVAIINFSGNVGKTTISKYLLAPRMNNATEFAVETINDDESDNSSIRFKGKDYINLQEELLYHDSAIVDIGASNAEEFVKLMRQLSGSQNEFDYYILPVVGDKKQQVDTINTIKVLSGFGIQPDRIKLILNRVDLNDADPEDLKRQFSILFGYHISEQTFSLSTDAVVFENEVFQRMRDLKTSIEEILNDETDYRQKLREATSENEKAQCVNRITAKRLAVSAKENLDTVFSAVLG